MGLSCAAYRAQDWFRQTWLASKLFYSGKRYQHFGTITLEGEVTYCHHNSSDGDYCFDLAPGATCVGGITASHWHCEATVCDPKVQDAVAALHIGQRVRVTGTRTYDPPHHIGPKQFVGGKQEIHPVTAIEILS